MTEVVLGQLNKLNSRAALYRRGAATGKTFVGGIDLYPQTETFWPLPNAIRATEACQSPDTWHQLQQLPRAQTVAGSYN